MSTVYVDYAAREQVAAMVIGGMTVAERVLREAAKSGATRAVVRGELPALPPLAIEVVAGDAPPEGASAIAGDVVAGVQISDEATRQKASHALFQTCRRPYDGLGDKYVIRAISLRFTQLFCVLGLSPNQVTSANVLIGFAACYFATLGTYAGFAIAGALMFLQVVLDSSDGELARIRHMYSNFGLWLDNTSDDLIDNLFLAALGIGAGGTSTTWGTIALVAAAMRGFVALWIHTAVWMRGKPGDVLAYKWWFDAEGESLAERFESTDMSLLGVLRSVGRRDLYCLIYAASCIAYVPAIAIVVGAANAVVHFAILVAHLWFTRRARSA